MLSFILGITFLSGGFLVITSLIMLMIGKYMDRKTIKNIPMKVTVLEKEKRNLK